MTTRRPWVLVLLLALFLPSQIYAGPSDSWHRKLDFALRKILTSTNGVGSQRVIVRFTPEAAEYALDFLKGKGTVLAEHRLINGVTIRVNSKIFETLAESSIVESISLDSPLGPMDAPAAQTPGVFNALRATLGLSDQSLTGSGVGVAVIDSGIGNSPDFGSRVSAFYDFTKGGRSTRPYDDFGHGTHVAGLIGGSGSCSGGEYQGVAPGVRLIGLKVLNAQGSGYTSDVLLALEFAINNRSQLGIDIVNLSLGHPVFESADTDPLVAAVERAVAAGMVVVSSAGNLGTNPATGIVGYAGISSPGNSVSALTVGAADTRGTAARSDDLVAAYSSRGPTWKDGHAKPDVIAPGHKLVSTATPGAMLYAQFPALRVDAAGGGKYLRLSGTSMAAGVTSGVVALVMEAYRRAQPWGPALPPNTVKAILQFTAIPLDGVDALTQGTGEVNAEGAVALAAALNLRAPRWGGSCLRSYVNPVSSVGTWSQQIIWADRLVFDATEHLVWGHNIVWSDNIVWGDNVVWGENIVWSDNIVWADNIVWSENIVWGENIVWADNIVWGDNVVWSDNIVWGERVLWSDGATSIGTNGGVR